MDKTDEILSGYQLIPLSDITPEARRIAVLWVEGFEPTGGIDIQQKHKLASDIMNYASQSTEGLRKELEEATAILKDVMMFINESQGIFGWHENGDNAYWEEFDFVKDIASFLSNRQVKA